MAFGSVTLRPGINVELTPTLLTAGYSQSRLVRFRNGLAQKIGGWTRFYTSVVSGVPRELHAWADLSEANHLLVGTTTTLGMITSGSFKDITPRTLTSDFAPNFSTVINTPTITVTDPNAGTLTVFDSVVFNIPVSVGGLILSGVYQVATVVGANVYTITAAANASSTVTNGGAVPLFTTTNGSSQVQVTLNNHGVTSSGVGTQVSFAVSTTGNGVTVDGVYTVTSIVDANNFNITASTEASASGSFSMNSGNAELVYYIVQGPPPSGSGYGTGPYGSGGYGTGTVVAPTMGSPITATDWTADNWGSIALACPENGGVFEYDPVGGFGQASLISTAPIINHGIFVSTTQQILVCWGSSHGDALGTINHDPLLVKWSTVGDFTVFNPLVTNQAGSYRIPNGTTLRVGLATPNQNLLWTDLDCWAMNYLGPPLVFGFNRIGAGAGAISSHAAQPLRGNVYWMGPSNFYSFTGNGVSVIPCPVWDFVFQNLNTSFAHNVRPMANTPFDEAGWFFPSNASANGENDCYVKFNVNEPGMPWDFGPSGSLPRSAWMDETILGNPIAASPSGVIYQHEETNDADGNALNASFTTGYFYIAEGEDFAFVDQIMPDFKWGLFGGNQSAQVQLTFNVVNFPGDTPTAYGPYTVTQATQYLIVRFRGRQMSITVQSSDIGSFWRLGKVRYRYSTSGRR